MASRVRSAFAVLTSAPWRRAPLLLWRRPGVLLAVAGGSIVLAASGAAVPLFLSSAGTGAVRVQAQARCPRDTGAVVAGVFAVPGVDRTMPEVAGPDVHDAPPADRPPDPFASIDGLGPSDLSFTLAAGLVAEDGNDETEVVILGRDTAADHVEVMEETGGTGVWLSDRAAGPAGLGAGDRATFAVDVTPVSASGDVGAPRSARVEVPVAGVYRDLTGRAQDDFWCSHSSLLELQGIDPVPPPPLVVTDRATYLDMMASLGLAGVSGQWEAPAALGDLTLADADALAAELRSATPEVTTHLPFVADRARAIRTSVAGGVVPVAGFGALAGVGLVGAAASLWFDRRRQEVTLLTVRGVAPVGLGLKAVLELAPALVAGTVAGVALAAGLVTWLGPSPLLEAPAMRGAVVGAAAALLVAGLVVGAVVAVRSRGTHGGRRARRRLAVVPWEVALVVAAVASHRRLGQWGVPVSSGADVSRVDMFGLLFPLLFLVAVVAVVARLLGLALRPLRAASRTWPAVPFLAVRRVARYRVAVLGLVAASAVAAGVLGYAATLTRSLNASLDAKARTFIGSDIALAVSDDDPVPDALAAAATTVDVYHGVTLGSGDDKEAAVMLVVDPATFERAAFWDRSFAGRSLADLLTDLAAPGDEGRIRAVVLGDEVVPHTEVRRRRYSEPVEVERVDGVDAFPGMRPSRPTVIVVASAVEDLELTDGVTEVWVAGDRDRVIEAYTDAGIGHREARAVDQVVDRASFLTVSWTFGVMQALGVVAGILVVGGMALYLDARRRSRVLGYAFARRMGLSRAAHRRVLLAELVASVVVGCWLGLGAAVVGARLAYGRIDPLPGLAPAPLLRPAVWLSVALAVGAVVVATAAAALAQRRTDRDDPLEVLRAGV
jgi:putative ABC transport system permease protein